MYMTLLSMNTKTDTINELQLELHRMRARLAESEKLLRLQEMCTKVAEQEVALLKKRLADVENKHECPSTRKGIRKGIRKSTRKGIRKSDRAFLFLGASRNTFTSREVPDDWDIVTEERFECVEIAIFSKKKADLTEQDQELIEDFGEPPSEFKSLFRDIIEKERLDVPILW